MSYGLADFHSDNDQRLDLAGSRRVRLPIVQKAIGVLLTQLSKRKMTAKGGGIEVTISEELDKVENVETPDLNDGSCRVYCSAI